MNVSALSCSHCWSASPPKRTLLLISSSRKAVRIIGIPQRTELYCGPGPRDSASGRGRKSRAARIHAIIVYCVVVWCQTTSKVLGSHNTAAEESLLAQCARRGWRRRFVYFVERRRATCTSHLGRLQIESPRPLSSAALRGRDSKVARPTVPKLQSLGAARSTESCPDRSTGNTTNVDN